MPDVRFQKPDRLVGEVSEFWRNLGIKQAGGFAAAIAGIVLTIVTAVVETNQLLLALIATFAQLTAAALFAGQGKAHPTHAKRAFVRLLQLARRVEQAEFTAQADFEAIGKSADARQTQMGILSAELSYIGEGIYSAAADWVAFNEALNEMVSEDQRRAMLEAAKDAQRAAETKELPNPDEVSQ